MIIIICNRDSNAAMLRDDVTGIFAPNALGRSCFDAIMCLTIEETDAKFTEEETEEE